MGARPGLRHAGHGIPEGDPGTIRHPVGTELPTMQRWLTQLITDNGPDVGIATFTSRAWNLPETCSARPIIEFPVLWNHGLRNPPNERRTTAHYRRLASGRASSTKGSARSVRDRERKHWTLWLHAVGSGGGDCLGIELSAGICNKADWFCWLRLQTSHIDTAVSSICGTYDTRTN